VRGARDAAALAEWPVREPAVREDQPLVTYREHRIDNRERSIEQPQHRQLLGAIVQRNAIITGAGSVDCGDRGGAGSRVGDAAV
jgi:hypothetical protein